MPFPALMMLFAIVAPLRLKTLKTFPSPMKLIAPPPGLVIVLLEMFAWSIVLAF
jgi:hypothetical protein